MSLLHISQRLLTTRDNIPAVAFFDEEESQEKIERFVNSQSDVKNVGAIWRVVR